MAGTLRTALPALWRDRVERPLTSGLSIEEFCAKGALRGRPSIGGGTGSGHGPHHEKPALHHRLAGVIAGPNMNFAGRIVMY
jgi:hypothetical protein